MTSSPRSRAAALPVHPARALVVVLLAALLTSLVTVAPAEAAARSRTGAEALAERVSLALHNEARQHPDRFGYGSLPAVGEMDAWTDIREVSRAWSDRQAAAKKMSHNPSYADQLCCWRRLAENVAFVSLRDLSNASVEAASRRIFQAWMDSSGHRTNIMNGAYDQFSVGVSITESQYGYSMYLTGNFRDPSSTPPGSAYFGPNASGSTRTGTEATAPTSDPATAAACEDANTTGTFSDLGSSVHGPNVDCMADWKVVVRSDGTSDGRFRVADRADRAFIATVIDRLATAAGKPLPPATRDHFRDDNGHVYEDAINRVAEAGLSTGYGDGTYRPSTSLTRAQMATLLAGAYRHFGFPTPSIIVDAFADDDGNLHETNIDLVAELSIASGTSASTFGPGDTLTRGQLTTFAARLANHAAKRGAAA